MSPPPAQPLTQGQIAAQRFKSFSHETLAAAVCPIAAPLSAEVFQTPDRISLSQAKQARYSPVHLGWHWGPAWSTAWFRIRGTVPASMAGQRVCLRFSTATEALLWRDDDPYHGFDINRETAVLFPKAKAGEPIDLYIEAACNHVLGITDQLFWEPPEHMARWREPTPGRFEKCELVTVDQDAWRLMRTFEFARLVLEQTPDDASHLGTLTAALESVVARWPSHTAEAIATIESAMNPGDTLTPSTCWTVGHAHLDTAWLWPIAETKRKALRTFATSLRLMERFPDYHFLCTQPQQYQWVKEQSPPLFEQIRARVKEGRWEPLGAFWVEPDGNLPSGESFIRQILHANRFWRENFPDLPPQRLAYLPDTFGFAASLPQIFRLAGLDTFITNKLWWNETNEFPHTHFRWRGIDGTEILSHLTPGQEYNATNTPFELIRGQRIASRKDPHHLPWLQPFGYGDGGGGPTDWNLLYSQLSAKCPVLPSTTPRGTADFCHQFHQRAAKLDAAGTSLPVYQGELYLERHRGTYTTQAQTKAGNARSEALLATAEWLTFAGPTSLPKADLAAARTKLDESWSLTLLNQFHDILPGSSIGEVYRDADRDHVKVFDVCEELEATATRRWGEAFDTQGFREPVLVFNPSSDRASGWVIGPTSEGNARRIFARDVPARGARVVEAAESEPRLSPARSEDVLDNGIVTARIDRRGRITSLCRTGAADVAAAAGLNQLVLFTDKPSHWDAWDIDEDYLNHAHPVETDVDRWMRMDSPGRQSIVVERQLGRGSRLIQTLILDDHSPRLDIHTQIDWREDHTLLRVLFPTNIRSTHATYEIPFGHIQRPTTRDNPLDKAKFEVPAHRWMDLSVPDANRTRGRGLAVLNECKYGHSCHGSIMGLSLLRSPKWPDPEADRGKHEFTYSLMPHAGDWRASEVDQQAELLTRPMWAVPLAPGHPGSIEDSWAPFRVSGTAAVRIVAIKPPESGEPNKLIVRLVESIGRGGKCVIDWRLPAHAVEPVDLLERPTALKLNHEQSPRVTTFAIKPFQIITLAVTLG